MAKRKLTAEQREDLLEQKRLDKTLAEVQDRVEIVDGEAKPVEPGESI